MTTTAPKVSVAMLAYNHEKYIAESIESVLAQKTDFEFELVIGEDESSDNTRAICQDYAKRYPDKIRLFLRSRADEERNKFPLLAAFNIHETYKACRGEYIAHLDGDDYWTDPEKLSILAGILDREPNTAFVAHRYLRFFEGDPAPIGDKFESDYAGKSELVVTYQNFLEPLVLLPSCMMFRRADLAGYFEKQCGWDVLLFGHLLSKGGRGLVLARIMGVYRKHAGGVWTKLSERDVHKWWHNQNTMLVTNEGFRSASVRNAYLRGSVTMSKDLLDDAIERMNAWHAHSAEVLNTTFTSDGSARRAKRATSVSHLMRTVEEMLIRGEAEYLELACTDRQSAGRAARLIRLAVIAVAASPLMLLVAVNRMLGRGRSA